MYLSYVSHRYLKGKAERKIYDSISRVLEEWRPGTTEERVGEYRGESVKSGTLRTTQILQIVRKSQVKYLCLLAMSHTDI